MQSDEDRESEIDDWRSVSDDSMAGDSDDDKKKKKKNRHFDLEEEEEEDERQRHQQEPDDEDDLDLEDVNENFAHLLENIENELEEEEGEEFTPRKSLSADNLFTATMETNIPSTREGSRSADSNRYSLDTEESSTSDPQRHRRRRKSNRPKNKSEKPRINSDESDESRFRLDSDDLSAEASRGRLDSLENPFSFDDLDLMTPKATKREDLFGDEDEDDEDDESFNFRSRKKGDGRGSERGDEDGEDSDGGGLYSDPSDDEKETRRQSTLQTSVKLPAIIISSNRNTSEGPNLSSEKSPGKPVSDFGNDDDSNSNLFPEQQQQQQQKMTISNSLKSLQKATSVVVPVCALPPPSPAVPPPTSAAVGVGVSAELERGRAETDKTRARDGSDTSKENETRSPFMTASFSSSTHSSSITPLSQPSLSSHPPPPSSLLSETIQDDPSPQKNKPSPLQVMASQRWNNRKQAKPAFAKFTEVHSFANAVKIVPDSGTNGGSPALVLCATADSTVRLIDAVTGKVQGMYEGHSDRVLAVAINEKIPGHEDETIQYVVAGSRDENVCVWNYKTRVCLQVLTGHDGAVWAVAVYVSLDGPPLAFSGSSDCSIRSWNILTGQVQHIFKGHSDTVLSLAVYNGGQYTLSSNCRVISGGADHMVRIWDMSTGRHCRMLEGHTDDVNTVSVVEDTFGTLFHGIKVISGGRDRIIRVWDLQRGAQIAEFPGHADCVYGVCGIVGNFETLQGVSTSTSPPSASSAASASNLRTLEHMSSKTSKSGHTRGTVVGHVNRSQSIWAQESHGTRMMPDSHGVNAAGDTSSSRPSIFLIISCSEDRTIKVWDVLGERLLATSKQHKGSVKGISLAPVMFPGDQLSLPSVSILLASCSWDKSVYFYDLDSLLVTEEKKCCTIS